MSSQPGIQLIVGLANPGAEYGRTRHNAGAWFVTGLADAGHAVLRAANQFQGLYCLTRVYEHDCHLLVPTTFMNHSGQAVKSLASYYKIPPEAILVAHDEIDLPVGDVRLKFGGGHGGHNGLRDVIQHLGSHQFYRLRIGVGRPGNSKEVVDYVLKPPKKGERELIDLALQEADKIMPLMLMGEYQKAMRQLHTRGPS
ncbi:MAG: pth [Gammaproteobacteria bacterium]|nr:pth [Gammaproteobacteria bacterium]